VYSDLVPVVDTRLGLWRVIQRLRAAESIAALTTVSGEVLDAPPAVPTDPTWVGAWVARSKELLAKARDMVASADKYVADQGRQIAKEVDASYRQLAWVLALTPLGPVVAPALAPALLADVKDVGHDAAAIGRGVLMGTGALVLLGLGVYLFAMLRR
jgi:hypothetical protein